MNLFENDKITLPLSDGVFEYFPNFFNFEKANEGIFVAIVDKAIAEDAVHLLRVNGWPLASIIGATNTQHTGQVLLKSAIGGRRVVNMLPGEQLPRIC